MLTHADIDAVDICCRTICMSLRCRQWRAPGSTSISKSDGQDCENAGRSWLPSSSRVRLMVGKPALQSGLAEGAVLLRPIAWQGLHGARAAYGWPVFRQANYRLDRTARVAAC